MNLQIISVLILVGGWLFGRLATRIGLPGVLGMILWGTFIGTMWRDSIPVELWNLAPFLKSLALIVILLRAGLGIQLSSLKKTGATVLKMALFPALFEAVALTFMFHFFLGFVWNTAALSATLLSAVSPAAVVPSMLALKEKGYGNDKDVPTMILTGASLDNVIVITMFSMFLGFARGENPGLVKTLLLIPWSFLLGIIPGVITGLLMVYFFRCHFTSIRATEKTLLLLGTSIILVQIGDWMNTAAVLGIMAIGLILLAKEKKVAEELSKKLGKIWIFNEIILFVLIGMSVQLGIALKAGPVALLLITGGLLCRSLGVLLATTGSPLDWKEKLFSIIAYLPKATVQAALGAVPLQMGIQGGELILAYTVVAILFTAPLGLTGIRKSGPKLLHIDSGKTV